MQRFLEHVARTDTCSPDWSLLEAPTIPEHIIACHLCALAAVEPDPSWRDGFELEAEHLREKTGIA